MPFYHNLYILYTFFTLIVLLDLLGSLFKKKLIYLQYQNIVIYIILLLYYFILSTRDLSVGTDTERYYYIYDAIYNYGSHVRVSSDAGFNLFNSLLALFDIKPYYYLYFSSLLFTIPIYYTIKQFRNTNKVIFLWFFFSLFIFISMSTNILRQGIGGAFVMWGISLFLNRETNNKRFLIPLIIAPLFHLSLILVIIVFFTTRYIKNIKVVYLILIVSIFLSYFGFNINNTLSNLPLVGGLFSDRMDVYLDMDNSKYQTGFRIDFLFFNLFFVVIGYYISKLQFVKSRYPMYKQIYTTYILLTSYFVLMFNVPFSDRFGILSWIFIPFIMYPIFDLSTYRFNNMKLGAFILGISLFIIFNVIGV